MTEEPTTTKEIHFRSINKEAFDKVNELRKRCKNKWNDFFINLSKDRESLAKLIYKQEGTDHCASQSVATVRRFLPMWCDNIVGNISYIKQYGSVAKLVCKSAPDCWKLTKLREHYKSKKEYSMNETEAECGLNEDTILKSVSMCGVTDSTFAGTDVCIGCINDIKANKPALIIGNGPSLEKHKHLELIKKNGFNGDIFCVTAALKKVLEHNIIPKYIGSLDGEQFDTTFIENDIVKENMDKLTGLFGTSIHPTTNHVFTGNRYFFTGHIGEDDAPNISHMIHLITKCPSISTCGNVGSSLWALATNLGYNPIILIGMDLSFESLESMRTYHSYIPDDLWYTEERKKLQKKWYNPEFHNYYYTDNVFEAYKISTTAWMELTKNTGIITINCTEQGSIHGSGVVCMKLIDYLKTQETV